jgi:hypothetical protein
MKKSLVFSLIVLLSAVLFGQVTHYIVDNSPEPQIINAGTQDVLFLGFRFGAPVDAYLVSRLTFKVKNVRSVSDLAMCYKDQNGIIQMLRVAVNNEDVEVILPQGQGIFVQAYTAEVVMIYLNIKPIYGTAGAYTNDQVSVLLTGYTLHNAGITTNVLANLQGPNHVIRKSFAFGYGINITNPLLPGTTNLIYKFRLGAAVGGLIKIKKLTVWISVEGRSSGQLTKLSNFSLMEDDVMLTPGDCGSNTYSIYKESSPWPSLDSSGYIDETGGGRRVTIVFHEARTIAAGACKTYSLFAELTGNRYHIQVAMSHSDYDYYKNDQYIKGVSRYDGRYVLTNQSGTATVNTDFIYSDCSGTLGNGLNIDICNGQGSSGDWFNGQYIKIVSDYQYFLSGDYKSITIPGRTVGAGTMIQAGVLASTLQPVLFSGFEMVNSRVNSYGNISNIDPQSFFLNFVFLKDWTVVTFLDTARFNIAAVGNPVMLQVELKKLGDMRYFVSGICQGPQFPGNISFFDGTEYWQVFPPEFNVLRMPMSCYGDLNNDGNINIADAIAMFNNIGQAMNDTMVVKSDLSGEGDVNSGDVYWLLYKLVNNNTIWPIFDVYFNRPQTMTISMVWKKVGSQWGLFCNEQISNGDLRVNGNVVRGNGLNGCLYKQQGDKVTFARGERISSQQPLLLADQPFNITGTLNQGQTVVVQTTTDVQDNFNEVKNFTLQQNYPNPFNPVTTISFSLRTTCQVSLKIYDMLGNQVAVLVDEQKSAGNHSVEFRAENLASGTYVYRLQAGDYSATKKMILMK